MKKERGRYRFRCFSKPRRKTDDEPKEEKELHVKFHKPDRSRYPRPTLWIIISAIGVILLWLMVKFIFMLANRVQ